MSTQKSKFELFSRLQSLGFTYDEAAALRRIEMTLHRWAEQECGDGDNWKSWCISRDEESGAPFMEVHPHDGKMRRYKIADREKGALRRCEAILKARNERAAQCGPDGVLVDEMTYYHQGDPRGCALYLLLASDHRGEQLDQIYTRGIAVAA